MAEIDNARLVEAKEAVSARLARLNLGRWHLRRVDRRLETYCRAVATHPDEHNLWELLAVERFLTMCGRYGINADYVRAFYSFYESLTFYGPQGPTRYRLTPVQCFQFAAIYGFWDGDRRVVREACLYVPRKFCKTTESAAFALWDLIMGDANARSYIGANSARQAKECFDVIRGGLLALDPGGRRFTVNELEVKSRVTSRPVQAQCLTANARTKDGLNASTVIMDEYSQARDAALYTVLTTSMGVRLNPLTVIITTASDVYTGPFYDKLNGYRRLLLGEFQADEVFVHLFEPDVGDDEGAESTWCKVHPHMGITVSLDYYREQWRTAQREGGEALLAFRTKLLNRYSQSTVSTWITRQEVERVMRPRLDIFPKNTVCMLGIDLSRVDDLTAITAAYYNTESFRMQLDTTYFFPRGALSGNPNEELYRKWAQEGWLELIDGDVIQYRPLFDHIARIAARVPLMGIGLDAYGSKDLNNNLTAMGYGKIIFAIPQSYGYFRDPVNYLERGIKDGVIAINDNPVNLWCYGNCYLDENSEGFKPQKRSRTQKIDGVITMLMAVRQYLYWRR